MSAQADRTDWKFFRPVTLVCLAVAVSAFAWGLGYKLDLYGPPHSGVHRLPEAKLLSKNEQTWLADNAQTVRAAAPARIPYMVCGGCFFVMSPIPDRRLRQALAWLRTRSGQLKRSALPALLRQFVRPPPDLT